MIRVRYQKMHNLLKMNMDKNKWIGLTVGEVLEQCKCDSSLLEHIDEPPGKLRAVKIICEMNGHKNPIVLEIEYDGSLFSIERNWSFDFVKKQKVVEVHLPGESFYDHV